MPTRHDAVHPTKFSSSILWLSPWPESDSSKRIKRKNNKQTGKENIRAKSSSTKKSGKSPKKPRSGPGLLFSPIKTQKEWTPRDLSAQVPFCFAPISVLCLFRFVRSPIKPFFVSFLVRLFACSPSKPRKKPRFGTNETRDTWSNRTVSSDAHFPTTRCCGFFTPPHSLPSVPSLIFFSVFFSVFYPTFFWVGLTLAFFPHLVFIPKSPYLLPLCPLSLTFPSFFWFGVVFFLLFFVAKRQKESPSRKKRKE